MALLTHTEGATPNLVNVSPIDENLAQEEIQLKLQDLDEEVFSPIA